MESHLKQVHSLKVTIRSEPNADLDMCLVVFSKHIVDGILVQDKSNLRMNRKTGGFVQDLEHGRVPGQTRLRNDVIAMLTSQEMDHVYATPQINLPCSPKVPPKLKAREPVVSTLTKPPPPLKSGASEKVPQWGSVTIQYGRLTPSQFDSVCANICMLHGEKTVCAHPDAPLPCTELVARGLGDTHHLVCMTLSEFDAVQSATQVDAKTHTLFVTGNARSMQRWGFNATPALLSAHGHPMTAGGWGAGRQSTAAAAAARALERKWRAQRGPGWPEDKQISFLTTTEALAGEFNSMVGMYGEILGVSAPDQAKVATFTMLLETLKRCCGAQMEPAYRTLLWGRGRDDEGGAGGGGGHTSNANGIDPRRQVSPVAAAGAPRHACDAHDLDKIEGRVLATDVFKKCHAVDALGKLSNFDPILTGHYCTTANYATTKYKLVQNDPRYLHLEDTAHTQRRV